MGCLESLQSNSRNNENGQSLMQSQGEDITQSRPNFRITGGESLPLPMRQEMQNEEICEKESTYTKIYLLGNTQISKVHLVGQENKAYAMKIVRKDTVTQKNLYDNVYIEMKILSMCKSDFIVKLYETFQTKERLYYILEFIPGGELPKKIYPEASARFYIAEILLAIEYLHSINVVYRDLKPSNILLDQSGHIKLIDFGISFIFTGQNCIETSGQLEYQAPEIIGIGGHNRMVDYWSLGILLHVMLSGEYPHDQKDRQKNITSGRLKLNNKLSAAATDLIQNLLINNPNERLGFRGAREVKCHPFFQEVNWEEVANRTATPPAVPHLTSNYDHSYYNPTTLESSEAFLHQGSESYSQPFDYKATDQ